MPRKLEQNIFPHKRRQVHAIVDHRGLILALQRNMACPRLQVEGILQGLKTAHTQAIQDQAQVSLQQQRILKLLHIEVVVQGLVSPNDIIARVNVQLIRR